MRGGKGWRRVVALTVLGATAGGAVPAAATSGAALIPSLTLVISPLVDENIPLDATAVALNVTVTEPMAPGFVTVYPCGERPEASNLNYVAGQTVPNFVIAALDADGDVCIDTLATTDVVVDIAGYVPAGSPLTMLEQPERFLDTRNGTGAPLRRVQARETLPVVVAGKNGVPDDASAVVFNATAVIASGSGFVTVFPCGRPIPETSTLNVTAGAIVPNLVTTALGPGGTVCIFTTVEMDLVGDVAAFLPAGASGVTLFDAPKRVVDSRYGIGGPAAPLTSLVQREVTNLTGVPADATAVIANLTSTESTVGGWLSAFPCGPVPPVSNVNYSAGQNIANHAYVPIVNVRRPAADADLRFVDIASGADGPELPQTSSVRSTVLIDRGCRGAATIDGTSGQQRLRFFDRSGAVTSTREFGTGDRLFVTDAGIVAFDRSSRTVYEALSDEDLFTLPGTSPNEWSLFDVSADGSTLVFGHYDPSGVDWLALDAGGGVLGLIVPPQGVTLYSSFFQPGPLSPNGSYLLYKTKDCSQAPPVTRCFEEGFVVATFDGTVVDRLSPRVGAPGGPQVRWQLGVWASNGTVLVQRSQVDFRTHPPFGTTISYDMTRWELFHEPVTLFDVPFEWWLKAGIVSVYAAR